MISLIRVFILVSLIAAASAASARSQENDFAPQRDARGQVGSMLTEIAKELIQRSSTNSQVLSLNLSNLLVLLVLKAVVFGAGYMGQQGYKARQLDEDAIISESEVALALGYLIGDNCLYRAACEVPRKAKEYLGAAEMVLQTLKLMPPSDQTELSKYEKTVAELKKAIEYGTVGKCPPQYACKKENINNFLKDA